MKQAARLIRLATASGGRIRIVRTADELETCLRTRASSGTEGVSPEESRSSASDGDGSSERAVRNLMRSKVSIPPI